MKKTGIAVLSFALFCCTGCAPIIIGAAVGAVGGYAISRDTIQGTSEKPFDSLWQSTQTVAKIRGTVVEINEQAGYTRLNVESSRVDINLARLTTQTTRVKVTARKNGFPNLKLAQDLYVKIMENAQ